jgi:hypothetical protein
MCSEINVDLAVEYKQTGRPSIRLVRTALSAVCGIAGLLLIMLWVRSYWRNDSVSISFDGSQAYMLRSVNGECAFFAVTTASKGITWRSARDVVGSPLPPSALGFRLSRSRAGRWPVVQYWSLALLLAILAIVPWRSRRFSLRALLIGVTAAVSPLTGVAIHVNLLVSPRFARFALLEACACRPLTS